MTALLTTQLSNEALHILRRDLVLAPRVYRELIVMRGRVLFTAERVMQSRMGDTISVKPPRRYAP